ncbi:MAG: hypothetical protein HY657_00405 [Acidobacteria bacterium]|nr:hypothetical protein [Acidobacteriota bacterium]
MPVRKYRSVEDMPQAVIRTPLDPRNLELACELSATALRLAPRRFPAGLHRYRSVADACAQREMWERSFTQSRG